MENRKVRFDSGFILDWGAAPQKRMYGFSYASFENDVPKKQLFYEVEVSFKDTTLNNCVFEIDRKTIYIDNTPSYSQIEKIANWAAQCIFPLRLKIKTNGELEQIIDHDEIRTRYRVARKEILEYYKGEPIEKIMTRIDTVFSNRDLLNKSITQNWFFHLFLKPLYIDYTQQLKTQCIWESPVFGNQCIEYGVVQSLQEHYTQDDKVIITMEGIATDERSIEEIRSGYHFSLAKFSGSEPSFVVSTMNVTYKLYEEDRSIFSVNGTFDTTINENTQQKIQVEIYHLTESSSYRPVSDVKKKESRKVFQSWQTAGDEDIIDISKPKWQIPAAVPPKNPKLPHEKIELFVGTGPDVNLTPGFWEWIKSIFKKNK